MYTEIIDNINKPNHYIGTYGLEVKDVTRNFIKGKSDSITDNLIRMKEAEAREKHGWVTVNGAGSVITNKE